MSPYQTIWITPPEVSLIAERFRQAANEIRSRISPTTRSVEINLEGNWVGNAKQVFFSHYDPFPDAVDQFAAELEAMASAIASIQVSIEQWYDDGTG